MKRNATWKHLGGVLFLCAALTGCQTTPPPVDTRPRFSESASADVILQFNRWDTIHILRPETREGGFLPILTREGVARQLQARQTGRHLAVVVLGFLFPPKIEAQYASELSEFLAAQGFQRFVVLRSGKGAGVDGLLIVHDSAIAGTREQAAARLAPLPAPAGADAAHSSGR